VERLNGFEPSTSTLARLEQTPTNPLEDQDLDNPGSKVCPEVCPPIQASAAAHTDIEVQGLLSVITRMVSGMTEDQRRETLTRLQSEFEAGRAHRDPIEVPEDIPYI
tara:strand:- start:2785 stop:3105 length:321 start_codon:yes stop_codon:yes gene_type:complete